MGNFELFLQQDTFEMSLPFTFSWFTLLQRPEHQVSEHMKHNSHYNKVIQDQNGNIYPAKGQRHHPNFLSKGQDY